MKIQKLAGTIPALALLFSVEAASAASVTPDIIFGSGNANGSFTVSNIASGLGNIEVGLRAKLRYNDSGNPENTFNWNGVDTYSFTPTAMTPSNRSVFNFEWHINSADTGRSIGNLINLGASALLEYDIDPSAATSFASYDPFAFDAYYGTNATPNGGGTYDNTGTPVTSATVAQNSVNYGFIPGAPLGQGIYDIKLSIFTVNSELLGSSAITISTVPAVPLPAALPLLLAALGGLGFAARRRKAA